MKGEEEMKKEKMNVFNRNKLKIAKETLKMSNALVNYFNLSSVMTKERARQFISEIERKYSEGRVRK